MNRWLGAVSIAGGVALFATSASPVRAAPQAAMSGLDLASFDRTVRPQDDLYRFANGRWLATDVIPPDRVGDGTFVEMSDKTEADLRAVIEAAQAASKRPKGSLLQQIGDFYASYMDEARVNALGAAPLKAGIARIDAIKTPSDFAAEAGRMVLVGAGGAFGANVVSDAQDPTKLMVQVSQGGIRMPNADYYVKPDPMFAEARSKYETYLATIFTLADRPEPARTAHDVLMLETAIAKAEMSPLDSREPSRGPRQATLSELMTSMPGFDWKAWAKPQGIDQFPRVVLLQPDFFKAFAALVPAFPLETWKSWLVSRHIYQETPYLSQPFIDARFEFFGRFLQGQTELPARWKGGVALLSYFLGDALGQLYVEKEFSPTTKLRAAHVVANVIMAYRQAIAETPWLSSRTKDEALQKLAGITPRIGFPETWRDYSGLVFTPNDLFGNFQRAQAFYNNDRLARETGGTDTGTWLLNVQSVNAYYNPAQNEIVLPAALLQPPLFDVQADDAVNYGALGATVGHEISHAFDQSGRRYDARGNIRPWWTPAEEREYRARTAGLIAAFSALTPIDGLHVNGELTLPENLADLIGLSVAYRAYTLSLNGHPAPVIDGFTGPQRFFLGYARMWRMKVHEDYLRQWLLTVPYSPEEYRTNVIVSNTPAFYAAFGVTPDDRLFRAPEKRVRIW